MSNNYQYINTGTTTIIGAAGYRRISLMAIFVNKTLAGTATIKAGATTIGILAVGTLAGTYWYADEGTEIQDLQIVTSAADDLTVSYNNL
jgi:hypothetical protein